MKTIYNSVLKRLTEQVPELRWIDLDFGQLEQRPPVAFPCALITIGIPQCGDITDTLQRCAAEIRIRLAFDPLGLGRTAANAPEDIREQSLNPYDTIANVYAALQGYETENFNALSRRSQEKEGRTDLFIYRMTFTCEFEDETADG